MEQLSEYLHIELLGGNTVGNVAAFAFTLLCGLVLSKLVTLLFRGRLRDWANKTKTKFDDQVLLMLERPLSLFLLGVGARASIEFLRLSEVLDKLL